MAITVVLGASRGLGYQFVKTLAALGETVIATARNPPSLTTKLQTDSIPTTNIHVIEADLTSYPSLLSAAATTSTLTSSKIDHLLINGAYLSTNTAGKNPTDFAADPELFLSELQKSNDANIAGPLYAVNAFLPLLRQGEGKRVTAISSGTASIPETINVRLTNSVPYSASKAGGNVILAKFAAELWDEGFRFLSVAPGGVATETLMDMGHYTDDEKAKMQVMFARMMEKYPEWKGPVTPEVSVERILEVVKNFKVEQSGQFLSYWGNETQWL